MQDTTSANRYLARVTELTGWSEWHFSQRGKDLRRRGSRVPWGRRRGARFF